MRLGESPYRELTVEERLLHPTNIVLLVIMLLFAAWEIVAAVIDSGPADSMVTLSEYVWYFTENWPWVGIPVVAGFCIWLFVHFFKLIKGV